MTTFPCGYTTVWTRDVPRSRPVAVDLWYPAAASSVETTHDYGLGTGWAATDAEAASGRFPVVVLSHGAYGAARNYSWVAEHLARCGYLVCGVSHFGESYVYGVETIDPLAAMQLGDRAQDCSFALDHLLTDSPFREVADPSRVGALGHSSGGATVVVLAGGTFDPGLMRRYCASDEAVEDKGCAYGRRPGATGSGTGQASVRRRDVRVRVVVALDPALGPGFEPGSLAGIAVPVHVVGSEQNDFLPIEHHAARYARLIPGAGFTRLNGGEGHFVYLDRCAGNRDANGVPLCRDRAGVDRRAVHEQLRQEVRAFFDRHLEPAGSR